MKKSLGEKLSDKVSEVCGSWTFILSFLLVMGIWICLNTGLLRHPFDPPPYMGLNLFLSTVAAIQAPLIMMSQNRLAQTDRERAIEDHELNKKINQKLDALIKADAAIIRKQDTILEELDDE